MNRIIKLSFVFIISLIALCSLCLLNNKVDAEGLVNEKGYSICYPGSNISITIPEYKKQTTEFRGVWVSFIVNDISRYSSDVQMQQQLLKLLDGMEEFNMNAIMFHIRTHNNAYYDTELAPQSSYVKGMNYEEFDYLEWFINECHKRGIEFHAWLNPYRISNGTTMAEILSDYKDYPVNPAHDAENVLINADGEAILDPGVPAVQDYIVNVCMEIIEKYDVDAIHFDDYFYISDVDDSATRAKYNTTKLGVDDFRRKSVDDFIYKLSTQMYKYNVKNNRTVQLGISPSAIYRNVGTSSYISPSNYKWDANGNLTYPVGSCSNGYAHYGNPLYCDTKKWIDNEWIDYIIPQVYNGFTTSAACYASVVEWWNAVVKNKKCNLYIGTGLYKKGSSSSESWYTSEDEWYNQLRFNQKNTNVDGTCVFQYKSLKTHYNSTGVQKVINQAFTNDTLLPVLNHYSDMFDNNLQATNLKIYRAKNQTVLTWDRVDNAKNYYIYQYSDSLDLTNPNQIIGKAGNDDNDNTCIFNFTFDGTKGNNFAVVPLNEANEICLSSTININKYSTFDETTEVVKFNDMFVTGIITGGARLSLRFSDVYVKYGSNVTYEVYMVNGNEWDDSKAVKLDVTKASETNYASFTIDKYCTPITLKVLAKTEFGSCYSDEVHVNIKYENPTDLFGAIFKRVDYMISSLYGE